MTEHHDAETAVPTVVINLKGRLRDYGPRLATAPEGVVYVGRRLTMGGWGLAGHPLSNPYSVRQCGSPAEAVDRYRAHLASRPDLLALVPTLRGKTLACWCVPAPCHALVLAELADDPRQTRLSAGRTTMTRHPRPRAPRRAPEMPSAGQLGLFGSPDPWQPTRDCQCWPPAPRGCHHCKNCDTCQDCGHCAGPGCSCACDD